jgi:hypothetical protein
MGVAAALLGWQASDCERDLVKKIVESLELGMPMKWACKANGICAETWTNWQDKHPELVDIAEQAKGRFIQAHLHSIKIHAKDNWAASMTLLELRSRGFCASCR